MFSDPLAERLAGEQGRAIVARVPRSTRNGWWLIARTKIIDDVITRSIADGCDRVLNLAAGLDTRPYRLDLPSDFPWIEADLPPLLAEKTQLLEDQTPRCRLTRAAVDLSDPHARDAFLNEALDGATKALVLTEGLLMYLEDRDVIALSAAIKRPEVAWWMLDFAGPGLKKMMNKKTIIKKQYDNVAIVSFANKNHQYRQISFVSVVMLIVDVLHNRSVHRFHFLFNAKIVNRIFIFVIFRLFSIMINNYLCIYSKLQFKII